MIMKLCEQSRVLLSRYRNLIFLQYIQLAYTVISIQSTDNRISDFGFYESADAEQDIPATIYSQFDYSDRLNYSQSTEFATAGQFFSSRKLDIDLDLVSNQVANFLVLQAILARQGSQHFNLQITALNDFPLVAPLSRFIIVFDFGQSLVLEVQTSVFDTKTRTFSLNCRTVTT